MKSGTLEMCLLWDFYGDILTDKQREFFDLYFNEDLSLAEISENSGITRQGVRDAIMRAETTLRDMEDKLGFVRRYGKIQTELVKISESAALIQSINQKQYRNPEIAAQIDNMLKILSDLTKE